MPLTRRAFVSTAAAATLLMPYASRGQTNGARIRCGQIGTQHAHASGQMATMRKLFDPNAAFERSPIITGKVSGISRVGSLMFWFDCGMFGIASGCGVTCEKTGSRPFSTQPSVSTSADIDSAYDARRLRRGIESPQVALIEGFETPSLSLVVSSHDSVVNFFLRVQIPRGETSTISRRGLIP